MLISAHLPKGLSLLLFAGRTPPTCLPGGCQLSCLHVHASWRTLLVGQRVTRRVASAARAFLCLRLYGSSTYLVQSSTPLEIGNTKFSAYFIPGTWYERRSAHLKFEFVHHTSPIIDCVCSYQHDALLKEVESPREFGVLGGYDRF